MMFLAADASRSARYPHSGQAKTLRPPSFLWIDPHAPEDVAPPTAHSAYGLHADEAAFLLNHVEHITPRDKNNGSINESRDEIGVHVVDEVLHKLTFAQHGHGGGAAVSSSFEGTSQRTDVVCTHLIVTAEEGGGEVGSMAECMLGCHVEVEVADVGSTEHTAREGLGIWHLTRDERAMRLDSMPH